MISHTAEYALRAMVHLCAWPHIPRTAKQIAQATDVSQGYLSKVLQLLHRAALVSSQRGPHGGFCLNRPPDQITIFDVVRAVDPKCRSRHAHVGSPVQRTKWHRLDRRLDDAVETIERKLAETTIVDLVDEKPQSDAHAGADALHPSSTRLSD